MPLNISSTIQVNDQTTRQRSKFEAVGPGFGVENTNNLSSMFPNSPIHTTLTDASVVSRNSFYQDPDTPAAVITGNTNKEKLISAYSNFIDGTVSKGFGFDTLVDAVNLNYGHANKPSFANSIAQIDNANLGDNPSSGYPNLKSSSTGGFDQARDANVSLTRNDDLPGTVPNSDEDTISSYFTSKYNP